MTCPYTTGATRSVGLRKEFRKESIYNNEAPENLPRGSSDDGQTISMVFRDIESYDAMFDALFYSL